MKPRTQIYRRVLSLIVSVCLIAFIGRSVSSPPKDQFIGIASEDEKYYKSSGYSIKCKDGTNKFTKAQLNDDFCDCPDGSDEPGTSACPTGKFYCRNAGHIPLTLYSSRVNDGICDCCDGSDEYTGKVNCSNTCWEAGRVARDKLKKKIATYQEGVKLHQQEVEQAKIAIAKDKAELSKLKNEEKILKGLVEQLKEHKEQIEKAEEEERKQKEKEERAKKEAEEKSNRQKEKEESVERGDEGNFNHQDSHDHGKADNEEKEPQDTLNVDKIGNIDNYPGDEDVAEEYDELVANSENSHTYGNGKSPHDATPAVQDNAESETIEGLDINDGGESSQDGKLEKDAESNEALSREELGRLVASRWTRESKDQPTSEAHAAKDSNPEDQEDTPEDTHNDEYDDGYAPESDDEKGYDEREDTETIADEDFREEDHDDSSSSYKYDSDDELRVPDDTTREGKLSWLEKIQQSVRNLLQAVNLFKTPIDKSDAARIRKEYEESNAKLSKIQSRISSLTHKLKQDFGQDKGFYTFHDRCFESKQNKYVYKVCPFKQATQLEGHSTTHLGRWDKFEDSHRVMVFSNGDKCWNGPDRSLKVKLKCGLKNEITDVDEPSRCEYSAWLSTPALCLEEKLKELEHKLDMMNKEQTQIHDEL